MISVLLFNLIGKQTILLILISFLLPLLFLFLLNKWILKPMRLIEKSLNNNTPALLDDISPANHEFSALAQMLQNTFKVKRTLEIEISERRKAELLIKQYTEKLESSNQSKDKFFSLLAHDLKSPFHALLGYSEILRNDHDKLSVDERRKFVEIIYNSSKQVYDLLENLLQWSRLQTNRVSFTPEMLLISRETDFMINQLKGLAIKKGIRTHNMIPEGTLAYADKSMVHSILLNLISNAIKFTPSNGDITFEAILMESGFLEISITDTGIGINDQDLQKLFRIDVQFTRKGTENEAGTGLGLILCRELVEKNGGSIRVMSTPGRGSTFIFNLPAKEPAGKN